MAQLEVFGGLVVTGLAGVLKATTGLISGSAVHSDLGSIGANDHHNQSHVLNGADHTVSGLTTGHVLQALSATTFGFALTPGIHGPVTIPVAANGLSLTGQEISLPTTASPTFAGLTVDTNTIFVDSVNHKLGIGTTSPDVTYLMTVAGVLRCTGCIAIRDTSQSYLIARTFRDGASGSYFMGQTARGTEASPTVSLENDVVATFYGDGYSVAAGGFKHAASIEFAIDGEPDTLGDTTDMPGRLVFKTSANGTTSLTECARITSGGLLGIGTTAPDKQLEINSATGDCLRLTYNDANGSAANYVDYAVTSGGDGTITPSGGDTNVVGTLSAGDGGTTDYSRFEADGTLTFVGAATVFNDANVGSLVLQTGGTLPGIVEILDNDGDATGIYTRGFAVGEQGSGVIEVPHDYKEGTNLAFHVHWGSNIAPAGGTDNVQFRLIYSLSRDSNTFPDSVTVDKEVAYTTQYNWLRTDWTAINGATAGIGGAGVKIGDQFHFTLSRIAASADEFGGEALVATIGFHYECDTTGSRTITAK